MISDFNFSFSVTFVQNLNAIVQGSVITTKFNPGALFSSWLSSTISITREFGVSPSFVRHKIMTFTDAFKFSLSQMF